MRLTESLLLYGLIGLGCGAYQLRLQGEGLAGRSMLMALSLLFWPLLLPMLLSRQEERRGPQASEERMAPGPYHDQIGQGMAEVEAAIAEAEGAAGQLLAKEGQILDAIGRQLRWLDSRLQEIQRLRQQPTFQVAQIEAELARATDAGAGEMTLESLAVKLQNAQQMADIEAEYGRRIEDSLALLGRIHSQITMLRFASDAAPQLAESTEQLLTLLDSLQEATALT